MRTANTQSDLAREELAFSDLKKDLARLEMTDRPDRGRRRKDQNIQWQECPAAAAVGQNLKRSKYSRFCTQIAGRLE
jgi:hypothetical protein